MLSRSRRTRHRAGYFIIGTSPSFGFATWSVVEYPRLNPACSRGGFSSTVFSTLFISTFVNTLQTYWSVIIDVFLISLLEIITILAFF